MLAVDDDFTFDLPLLYDKQREAIFCDARYGIVEASTKSGKTVGCITWLLAKAVESGGPGRNFWWVAPIYPQAKIAFRRLRAMFLQDDQKQLAWSDNKSELTITLINSSVIWFKGADEPDSLYGEDVWAAVIDEATRCKEDAWFALRSTLTATQGPIRIIGNVKGRKNWAYELARKAQAGEPGMHYAKLTAYDAVDGGVLEMAEIEDAKRTLPDHVFRELYLAEPSDDGGNPFGLDAIRACIVDDMGEKPIVVWGGDLAKSHDWTVMIGLNEHGEVAGFQRWQGDWRGTTKRIAAMVKDTPALIDATGVGDPIVEGLQRECPNVEGYKFTGAPTGKQQLMEGLAVAIQNQRVRFPRYVTVRNVDGEMVQQPNPLIPELESFEYQVRVNKDKQVTGMSYSAPGGMHDDCVCALALAVRRLDTRPAAPRLLGFGGDGNEVDEYASDYVAELDERLWSR